MQQPKVYIIILNWNGWRDTIECLESVLRLNYNNFQVIVCDNCSSDNSLEKIKLWADGMLSTYALSDLELSQYTSPPISKPISYVEYDREQVEDGLVSATRPPLILIQTGDNLGFAGGNNIGIKFALAQKNFDYIWLLNNDTVVNFDALTFMVEHMQKNRQIGICGATLLYYHEPNMIQALGGAKYNKWLGISKHVGLRSVFSRNNPNQFKSTAGLDYIVGASMLVKKRFIDDVGLMDEDYFLYFEELDWAVRMGSRYKLGYEPRSIVYHKEGASIGTSCDPKQRSFTSEYYALKNRIKFTRKHYPCALPTVYLGLGIALFNRIRRRQFDRVKMILKILFGCFFL